MQILAKLQSEFGCDTITGAEKLVVMAGDLSRPGLGLATGDYTTLCEEVDTVIHNGAIVNSVLPYSGTMCCTSSQDYYPCIQVFPQTRPLFYIRHFCCDLVIQLSRTAMSRVLRYSSKWLSQASPSSFTTSPLLESFQGQVVAMWMNP